MLPFFSCFPLLRLWDSWAWTYRLVNNKIWISLSFQYVLRLHSLGSDNWWLFIQPLQGLECFGFLLFPILGAQPLFLFDRHIMKLVQVQIKGRNTFHVFRRAWEDRINLLIRVKVVYHILGGLLLIPNEVVFLHRWLLDTWLLADWLVSLLIVLVVHPTSRNDLWLVQGWLKSQSFLSLCLYLLLFQHLFLSVQLLLLVQFLVARGRDSLYNTWLRPLIVFYNFSVHEVWIDVSVWIQSG